MAAETNDLPKDLHTVTATTNPATEKEKKAVSNQNLATETANLLTMTEVINLILNPEEKVMQAEQALQENIKKAIKKMTVHFLRKKEVMTTIQRTTVIFIKTNPVAELRK